MHKIEFRRANCKQGVHHDCANHKKAAFTLLPIIPYENATFWLGCDGCKRAKPSSNCGSEPSPEHARGSRRGSRRVLLLKLTYDYPYDYPLCALMLKLQRSMQRFIPPYVAYQ